MEPLGLPPQRDPDFTSGTALAPLPGPLIVPEDYLRIIANPFLGLAGLVGWWLAVRWIVSLFRKNPDLMGPLAPILAILLLATLCGVVPALFQYHCLDCGQTGRLSRWHSHLCLAAQLRKNSGRTRSFRGPTPFFQNILWLWITLTVGIIARANGWL